VDTGGAGVGDDAVERILHAAAATAPRVRVTRM
jgi:hypothetical protein